MLMVPKTASSERMIEEYGRYLVGQLNSHELTEDRGVSFREVQKGLIANVAGQKAAAEAVQTVLRRIRWAELEFFDAIRNFQNGLLSATGRDRDDLTYQTYFPGGLTDFRKLNLAEKVARAREMADQLDRESDDQLRGLISHFAPAVEQLEPLLTELETARQEAAELESAEDQLRRDWRREYRSLYHELMVLFRSKKRVVEVFFYRPERRKRQTAEEKAVASSEDSSGDES